VIDWESVWEVAGVCARGLACWVGFSFLLAGSWCLVCTGVRRIDADDLAERDLWAEFDRSSDGSSDGGDTGGNAPDPGRPDEWDPWAHPVLLAAEQAER